MPIIINPNLLAAHKIDAAIFVPESRIIRFTFTKLVSELGWVSVAATPHLHLARRLASSA